MGTFVFDNAKGRIAQLYYEAKNLGSPRGIVVVVIKRGANLDTDLEGFTSLSALLAAAPEVTNTNYARKVITSTGTGAGLLGALTYDSTHHWMPCDIPDQQWGSFGVWVGSGDVWTDAVFCYAPDTAGADSTLIPLTCHDFPAHPDGGSAIVLPVSNFYQAA